MTDTELDTASQSGFAALVDADDDEPFTVHGVAIGEDDVTHGASGDKTYWPRETLEAAAEGLAGKKIVDDSEHDDIEATQPPVSAILGEVTQAAYKPDVGVVFEGEIDDPDIAALVENGRVDVSPALFRELGEFDEDRDAHPATDIRKWRDLSVVSEGAAPSNTIQPGAAALQAEALQAMFDSDESESDESAESDLDADTSGDDGQAADGGQSTVDSTSDPTMDISDDEKALIRQARTLDNPAVIESDGEALKIDEEQYGDYAFVKEDIYNKHGQRVAGVKNRLADALRETSDLGSATISALDFDALWDEFTDDDDDIPDIAVLTQTPEAGGIGEDDEEGPTADDINEIESLLRRADTMDRHAPNHAESLRSEAADLAGVESHEDIDLEVL